MSATTPLTQRSDSDVGSLDFRKARKRSLNGSVSLRDLGYVLFPVKFLVLNLPVPCDLFIPVVIKGDALPTFVKILERGQLFTDTWKITFKQHRLDEVYVQSHDRHLLESYFQEAIEAMPENEERFNWQKSVILYNYGEFVAGHIYNDVHQEGHEKRSLQWAEAVGKFLQMKRVSISVFYRFFAKNYEIFSHSVHVALMAMTFCTFLGWRSEDVIRLGVAGVWHDIGKLWVDALILSSSSLLSQEEFAVIMKHPQTAFDHLESRGQLDTDQLAAVLQHHESMDGTGYPQGLRGTEIHPFARVLHICDCFDALTTHRPYRRAVTPFKALRLMEREMKLSFDRHLLYKFIQFLGS